jgi:hypothetical protein
MPFPRKALTLADAGANKAAESPADRGADGGAAAAVAEPAASAPKKLAKSRKQDS